MKRSENPQVEAALYTWFLQQRSKHVPISSEILKEKAKYFCEQITGKDDFRASAGWLDKFKQRHGIRFLKVCGERISNDESAVAPFKRKFMKIIEEMDLSEHQIYNADESALFWRVLPTGTWVHQNEKSAPGRKLSKDRLTFMPCCNSTGTHKLPLFVLGKSERPRVFKNVTLPVIYNGSKKGWMTKITFLNWFRNHFIPEVKRFSQQTNRTSKALLLIDNAPSHLITEDFDDPNFKILLMPPNCTAILQPMDQNLIQNIKVSYKKELLKYTVAFDDGNITQHLKDFNLKDAVCYLNKAWEGITQKNIVKSWQRLLPKWEEEDEIPLSRFIGMSTSNSSQINEDFKEIRIILNRIDANVSQDEIEEWALGKSESIPEMTEEDMINEVVNVNDSSSEEDNAPKITIRHEEAVKSFDICVRWAQENNLPLQDQLLLKCLREKAKLSHSKALTQTKIYSFFKH